MFTIQVDVEDHKLVTKAMKLIEDRFLAIWNKVVEVTERELGEVALPRVVRLCRKLKLSEKESKALTYVSFHSKSHV